MKVIACILFHITQPKMGGISGCGPVSLHNYNSCVIGFLSFQSVMVVFLQPVGVSYQNLRKEKRFIICLVLSCFVLFLLLLSSLSSFGYYVSPHSLVTGSMVAVGIAPDLLRSDGFNTFFIRSVTISSNNRSHFGPYPLNYSFYKTLCGDIRESCSLLIANRSCTQNVTGCNINYGNTGVFSGTGDKSTLTYISNINSSLLMKSCAFKLYLFDDKNKYIAVIKNITEPSGYIKESQCLPGVTNASVVTNTTTFLLKKSLFYYVAALTFDEDLKNTITISSYTWGYNVSGLQREACSITDTVNSCTVRISENIPTRKEQMCILTYSKESIPLTMNYSTTPTRFSNIGSILSFTFSWILLFACLVTGITGLICFKYYHSGKKLSALPFNSNPFVNYESIRTLN